MSTITIRVRRKGIITLPREVRRRYKLDEGDVFTLVDLGDGCLLLRPQVSQLARLADQAARTIADDGVSLEELLRTLDQERETYYRDHFAKA